METILPIHIGALDKKTLELVELIDSYNLSTDFAHWITNGKYNCVILKELSEEDKYTRIVQYRLDDCIFFNGTGEFYTDKLDQNTVTLLTQTPAPIYSDDPYFGKLKKVNISKVISDPYYTVMSRFYVGDEITGISWAVYNIPRLLTIYGKKQRGQTI